MRIQNSKQNEAILSELQTNGLKFLVTGESSLRIVGKATPAQIETCRLFKARIIETVSPHCSNCDLPMQLINGGELWFCPLGCSSRQI